MALTEKFKYRIVLRYMKKDTKKYRTLDFMDIEFMLVDRDYDRYNMPIVYLGLYIDEDLADDIIKNEKDNCMNLEVYKFKYDDDGHMMRLDESYIRSQCTYFTADVSTNTFPLDTSTDNTDNDGNREDLRRITIGLMQISLINSNAITFNNTFDKTTPINAVRSVTNHIDDMIIEPFSYMTDELNQIAVYENTVSKSLNALNKVKVFYSTQYRFFMDFDATYLLSSRGIEVPRKGERIAAVLICIKNEDDYAGMDDGMYVNKTQGNYQINVSIESTSSYVDRLTDKMYNNIVAVTNSGEKTQFDLNIDRSSFGSSKSKTVYIPNDNVHMIENIKSQTENGGVLLTICKECIDTSVLTPNHRILVKHTVGNEDKDGDYIMTKKQEIFVRDGRDFILSTIVNLRKIR